MRSPTTLPTRSRREDPISLDDIPIVYEDEDEGDMGEANLHVITDEILHIGLDAHMQRRHPDVQVFSNMNCYYRNGPPHPRTGSLPYVSPDAMAVRPFRRLPENLVSYTIGEDGPAPLMTGEILSKRSAQQGDRKEKVAIYAKIGVAEYVLIDCTGQFLPERLLLKRLQADGTWKDEQDPDGGVTSALGFRLIIDTDDLLRVVDAESGKPYLRPDEAQDAVDRLSAAEQRIRELEDEIARARAKKRKKRKDSREP